MGFIDDVRRENETLALRLAKMSHEDLIDWSRSDFMGGKSLRETWISIVAGMVLREKPGEVLHLWAGTKAGHDWLAEAAKAIRSKGNKVPAPIMEFLLDVSLGIIVLPKRDRGVRMPEDMTFLNVNLRNELIYKHVYMISEYTDLCVSRNSQNKVRKVDASKETACGIVAKALGNLKEETVKKIYEEESRKLAERMDDPDWLDALEE